MVCVGLIHGPEGFPEQPLDPIPDNGISDLFGHNQTQPVLLRGFHRGGRSNDHQTRRYHLETEAEDSIKVSFGEQSPRFGK